MQVIKISGNELHQPQYLAEFAQCVASLKSAAVIVHGGGQAISDLQEQMGLVPNKIDGLRISDVPTMKATEMALSGWVNKLLVRSFLAAGIEAIGLSGIDGRLLQCHKKRHPLTDLGFVGQVHAINAPLIKQLLEIGVTVVLSPISLGEDGQAYNVNADEAATAVAAGLSARQLTFVSNVPGVLQNGRLRSSLTIAEGESLIEQGIIVDGMIPKVRAATQAIKDGIPQTKIVDLKGLKTDAGTLFLL